MKKSAGNMNPKHIPPTKVARRMGGEPKGTKVKTANGGPIGLNVGGKRC